jgi:hypothetical protein
MMLVLPITITVNRPAETSEGATTFQFSLFSQNKGSRFSIVIKECWNALSAVKTFYSEYVKTPS